MLTLNCVLFFLILLYLFLFQHSFAAGQMNASPFGGSVTPWMTVEMAQTNLQIAVSALLFSFGFKIWDKTMFFFYIISFFWSPVIVPALIYLYLRHF